MTPNRAVRRSRRAATYLVASFAAAAPIASLAVDAPVAMGLRSLESAFWRCDFDATERGLDHVDVGQCVDVYEALKRAKFEGDFAQLLAWWQSNKPAEHAKLRAGLRVDRDR